MCTHWLTDKERYCNNPPKRTDRDGRCAEHPVAKVGRGTPSASTLAPIVVLDVRGDPEWAVDVLERSLKDGIHEQHVRTAAEVVAGRLRHPSRGGTLRQRYTDVLVEFAPDEVLASVPDLFDDGDALVELAPSNAPAVARS